jgi:hypothetical protein
MIQKIVDFTGLPSLFIETGFLLLLTFLIIIVVFLVMAIFRIKNEMIKMGYTINYIARLLERGYKTRKLYKVNYDLQTEEIVLEMLQQGKSDKEIMQAIPVSKEYIDIIASVATEKGLLSNRPGGFKAGEGEI